MAKPKSIENQLKEANAKIAQARAILLCQGFMDLKFPEAMQVAIKEFLESTK